MLRRIIYSSKAATGIGIRDAYDIIRTSHNRNSQAGITGGLILIDGYFFQILEGLPAAVEERLKRITADPRHSEIEIRADANIDEPVFESEWMALRDGDVVDSDLLAEHGYSIGMPAEQHTAEQLFQFMLSCFEKDMANN